MRRITVVALVLMLMLCAFPALADAATVGVVCGQSGNAFFDLAIRGFEEAQAELGFELLYDGPDDGSAAGQIAIIQDYVQRGVDAIAVSANDPGGLVDVLRAAMDRGIKVVSWNAEVAAEGRLLHIEPSSIAHMSRALVREIAAQMDGEGQVAILRGPRPMTGGDAWMECITEELGKEEYKDIELVAVAYGEDEADKSYEEMQGLIDAWPDLVGVISPSTVGLAAAAACVRDHGLSGRLRLTGLGLPSEMADYIRDGTCEGMYLWNPMDWGYDAAYATMALVNGDIEGKTGESFEAGRLGTQEVLAAAGGGVYAVIGEPFYCNIENIDAWEGAY